MGHVLPVTLCLVSNPNSTSTLPNTSCPCFQDAQDSTILRSLLKIYHVRSSHNPSPFLFCPPHEKSGQHLLHVLFLQLFTIAALAIYSYHYIETAFFMVIYNHLTAKPQPVFSPSPWWQRISTASQKGSYHLSFEPQTHFGFLDSVLIVHIPS